MLVLLLLIGAGHDLWRVRGTPPHPPRAPEPGAWDAAPAPGAVAGSGPVLDSAASDTAGSPPGAAVPRAPIDLNRAGAGELDRLPGVGPVLAGRIVLQRRRFGPFHEVDELLAVRGVGPRLLERIRPWATVETTPGPARAAADTTLSRMAESRR